MRSLHQSLSVLVLYIFLFALIKYAHGADTKLENVLYGKRLEGFSFVSYYGRDIRDCVDKCGRRVQCRSLNYHKGVKMCELNTKGAVFFIIYLEYEESVTRVGLFPFVHIV